MNDYGQIRESSLGECVDLLLEALTIYAYGPYEHPGAPEPPAVVDGMKVAQKVQNNPQHQLNTDCIKVVNPAFYAEKKAFEQFLKKHLRRYYNRLQLLNGGLCLACQEENDQRHRRFCSLCEEKFAREKELTKSCQGGIFQENEKRE